jgi:hypothetical protein
LFSGDNNVTAAKNEIIYALIADPITSQSYGNTTYLVNGSLSADTMTLSNYGATAGWGGHRLRHESRPDSRDLILGQIDLEPVKRGPYAGVVGYVDFSGTIDTAIAIRTLVVGADGIAHVQAGAGIVADSVAEHEDLECRNKARGLLSAVPGARRMTAQRRGEVAD